MISTYAVRCCTLSSPQALLQLTAIVCCCCCSRHWQTEQGLNSLLVSNMLGACLLSCTVPSFLPIAGAIMHDMQRVAAAAQEEARATHVRARNAWRVGQAPAPRRSIRREQSAQSPRIARWPGSRPLRPAMTVSYSVLYDAHFLRAEPSVQRQVLHPLAVQTK